MPAYDLLIQHGDVFLPYTRTRAKLDVAIQGDCVAALAERIPATESRRVLDARGKLVTPGLIDLHTHLGFELHTQVLDPDPVCSRSGVTTAVDMGSTGAFTFSWYRSRVLERAIPRMLVFLNIASLGTIAIHNPYYVENYGRYIDIDDTVRTVEANRDYVCGIKVFCSGVMVGQWALDAVRAAVQVGERVRLPVAMHVSDPPPDLAPLLECLRPGDIMTHTLTPHRQGILDSSGKLKACVLAARARGVLFDTGHGAGSFAFEVARGAFGQGFWPDTISTDLYYANLNGPVYDLPTTMSKFLNLGMPLEEVIARATCGPARALRQAGLGTLDVGAPADVAILQLVEGSHTFMDVLGQKLEGRWRLVCDATVRAGKVVYERSQA